jgi:CrcB protein
MNIILVLLLGVVGVALRYGIDRVFLTSSLPFPWSTFFINILGCALAGFIFGYNKGDLTSDFQVALVVGFCGGFTTFSSFSLQCYTLIQSGQWIAGSLYLTLTPALCLIATESGIFLSKSFA